MIKSNEPYVNPPEVVSYDLIKTYNGIPLSKKEKRNSPPAYKDAYHEHFPENFSIEDDKKQHK